MYFIFIYNGMMNREKYIFTLRSKMIPSANSVFSEFSGLVVPGQQCALPSNKEIQEWMAQKHVERLPWPARSPDLNPIENLWQRMGTILSKTQDKKEFMEGIMGAWHGLLKQMS